ncbi:MAG: 6-phosphogluconolactonase, partial [Planctomycetota bacterium]
METSARYKPVIKVASDPTDLANKGLELFIAESTRAIRAKDMFCVAISGGQTPKHLFELIGESEEAKALDWDKIHLFWVDERYVPSDSKWSNYKLALDTFLLKVDIPGENIHRIPTEESDFQMAARSYEHSIREVFNLEKAEIPVFDLIILGMGAEGHTGSLFPNSYAALDTNDLACVVYVMDG